MTGVRDLLGINVVVVMDSDDKDGVVVVVVVAVVFAHGKKALP